MPFKNRIKQLRYMREHAKKNRELLKLCKARMELTRTLNEKAICLARQHLEERRKYPIEIIPDSKPFSTSIFQIPFTLYSEGGLEKAVREICQAEDELIRNSKDVRKIGVINDLQVSLLNDKYAIVWEKVTTLTDEDIINLSLPNNP